MNLDNGQAVSCPTRPSRPPRARAASASRSVHTGTASPSVPTTSPGRAATLRARRRGVGECLLTLAVVDRTARVIEVVPVGNGEICLSRHAGDCPTSRAKQHLRGRRRSGRGPTARSAPTTRKHESECDAAEAAPDCRFQRRACSQSKPSDLLHPAVGDVQVRSGRGSLTCFEEAALLTTAANLRTPKLPTSHRRDDVAGETDTLAIAD
jgi:hypothetical protein